MSAQVYLVHNGPMATTGAAIKQAANVTVATPKTQIQILNSATAWRVVEWGISFDGTPSAASSLVPITVELMATSTVAATVTAFATADITQFSDPASNAPPSQTNSTSGSGYNASAEGTITSVRLGDFQLINPGASYVKQYPLGREFEVQATHCGRIRVTVPTGGTNVNCSAYIIYEV